MSARPIVLIVDDEPGVCWSLETLLSRHGFAVTSVMSGAAALAWLQTRDQDCRLILVDAKLGDTEGIELARQIRVQTHCHAPVILVSGYYHRDDNLVQDNLNSGFISAFVTKPFRHNEILGAIEDSLSAQGIAQ